MKEIPGEEGWEPLRLPHQLMVEEHSQFLGRPPGVGAVSVRWFSDANGAFIGKAWFDAAAEGPPGHAHGGSMAAVLDEAMGGCAWFAGHPVLAGEITIRFHHSAPLLRLYRVEAEVTGVEGRKVATAGRLLGGDGRLHASGTGVFVIMPAERFRAMGGWR